MDEIQAEAAGNAILEPERQRRLEEQERSRLRRAQAELYHRRRRVMAWFVICGGAAGAVVAHFSGHPLSRGVLAGAAVGMLVGWLVAQVKIRAAPVEPVDQPRTHR